MDLSPNPSPEQQARVRRLKKIVAVLGIIMVALFLFLVGAIIYRFGQMEINSKGPAAIEAPPAPRDATLLDWQIDDDHVAVRYRTADGTDLLFIRKLEGNGPWQQINLSTR